MVTQNTGMKGHEQGEKTVLLMLVFEKSRGSVEMAEEFVARIVTAIGEVPESPRISENITRFHTLRSRLKFQSHTLLTIVVSLMLFSILF